MFLFSQFVFLGIHPSIIVFPPSVFFFPMAGITNYEEYSLIQETVEEKKEDGMGTLKKDRTLLRDERKMEKLKAKLHTDDEREFSSARFRHCFSCARGHEEVLEPIPAVSGRRRGHTLDKSPVYRRASQTRQTTISEPITRWQGRRLVRLSPPQQTFNAHK